jgi:imidazolonepropionase-like amidohydrolase
MRRIPEENVQTYAPAWHPSGKQLAYVTWSDRDRGHVWLREIDESGNWGKAERVTRYPGYYSNPVFSHDGRRLAFVQGSGAEARGLSPLSQAWLQIAWVDLITKRQTPVVRLRNRGSLNRMPHPSFYPNGKRVFFTRIHTQGYRQVTSLCSTRLDGTDERKYLDIFGADDVVVSPDRRWVLFWHLHQIYLTILPPPQPQPLALNIQDGQYTNSPLPILQLSDIGGSWPSWTQQQHILWNLGPKLHLLPLSKAIEILHKSAASRPTKAAHKVQLSPKPTIIDMQIEQAVAKPTGCVALMNLNILTMNGRDVIPNGTIVLQNERIARVGPSEQIAIPDTCRRFDLQGRYALPGFIDTHAHLHYNTMEIYPQNYWEHYVNLAYGVTTVFDPSAPTEFSLQLAERIRAGLTVGPRVLSTGFILYGAENTHKAIIRNLDDARRHVQRLKQLGAWAVKSYMQPTRQQRQWLIQAAREAQMLVVPEGGGDLNMNLSMILDGHSSIEHAIPPATLYRDVVTLMARSHTYYTPTLLVTYGGAFGENFFFQQYPIWNCPKLRRFFPPRLFDAHTRRRHQLFLDHDWQYRTVAASATDIARAGGKILIGSHGQLQGLAYHWEMYAYHHGGATPYQVLQAATIHAAQHLGLQQDLGTISPHKLADLLILNHNPLHNLKHTQSIHWVIHNGIIYRADDMQRVYPSHQSRPRFLWQN